ncbi:hypothetical protein [Oceanotoga phage vB_OteS-UFV02]
MYKTVREKLEKLETKAFRNLEYQFKEKLTKLYEEEKPKIYTSPEFIKLKRLLGEVLKVSDEIKKKYPRYELVVRNKPDSDWTGYDWVIPENMYTIIRPHNRVLSSRNDSVEAINKEYSKKKQQLEKLFLTYALLLETRDSNKILEYFDELKEEIKKMGVEI